MKTINSFSFTLDEWKMYVDDIFAKWHHGIEKLHGFLVHLNSLSQHIKFTIEIEKYGKSPFIDVLLTKKEGGGLGYQVYRKDTHTDRYIHANSHYHPSQKVGIIRTLATREK